MAERDREWLEMRDLTRPRLATGTWIPLCVSADQRSKHFGDPEFSSDYNGIRTFAVPLEHKETAEELDFSDVTRGHGPYVDEEKYYATDVVLSHSEQPIGFHLVLVQSFSGDEHNEWTLNQDLVFALCLLREGDSWVCPLESFVEVAQLRRDPAGNPTGIYMRPDYLRDYLAARRMALRILQFRERQATMKTADTFGWEETRPMEERDGGVFAGSARQVGGESVMVMRVGRTDKWAEDELPEMGPQSDDNTVSERSQFNRPHLGLYAITGEFRRQEWLTPSEFSVRVRHDAVPSLVNFIIDGAGTRASADVLNDEDIGKWLWFKPSIIAELLSRRGSQISWYTFFTGGIELTSGYSVHFGLNSKELIVTYARDVARLPEPQRLIWAGFNVAPDGGLPKELEQAQVGGEAADTQPPEIWFERALVAVDQASINRWGWPLFRDHASTKEIGSKIHRYRALDDAGFLALAKDIARLTADRIDTARIQTVLTLVKDEKLGSLKSLERALRTIVSTSDLRLGDAHLPSEKLMAAFELVGVSYNEPALSRAAHLIHNVVGALFRIAKILDGDERGGT